jgi:formylglycine-generating enzyme
MAMRRGRAVVLAVAIAAVGGCTAIFGIDEPHVVDGGVDSAADGRAPDAPMREDGPGDTSVERDARDSGPRDAAPDASYPSCVAGGQGMTNCGASEDESCCASEVVDTPPDGATYNRTVHPTFENPATVSSFRLDKYEVTVGRFRQFVTAWDGGGGWLPAEESGTHSYLNDGRGLVNGGDADTFEPGWNPNWDTLDVNPSPENLSNCDGTSPSPYATWTNGADGGAENRPINCVNWYEAYAFCIWDQGFLPSEAEWEYAAVDGARERIFPWGDKPSPDASSYEYAIYDCDYPSPSAYETPGCADGGFWNIAPVGTARQGAGFFGQDDLGGNVSEWVFDNAPLIDAGSGVANAPYQNPCVNCADLEDASCHGVRGGAFENAYGFIEGATRFYGGAGTRSIHIGFRCARAP